MERSLLWKKKEILVLDVHNSIENEGRSLEEALQSFRVNLDNHDDVPLVVAVSRGKIVGMFYIKGSVRDEDTGRSQLVTKPVPFIFRILIGLNLDVKRKLHDRSAVRYKPLELHGITSLAFAMGDFNPSLGKILLGILALLLLILVLFLLPKSCKTKSETNLKKIDYAGQEFLVGFSEHVSLPERVVLSEMRFPEFVADSSEYRNDSEMQERCNFIAGILMEMVKNKVDSKFVIKGYVADFANEIDDEELALERALKIKAELVRRGIPEKLLLAVSGGKTNRWGSTNDSNRICTIESSKS